MDYFKEHGFIYHEDTDEWILNYVTYMYVIWDMDALSPFGDVYTLVYVDQEDYQHIVGKGTLEEIKKLFNDIYLRNNKIDNLLS